MNPWTNAPPQQPSEITDSASTDPAARLFFELLPQHWVAEASCAGLDPELFFPERGESTKEAKAVCRACPVRQQCLDYALSINERHGIWGGTSERERCAIRRQWTGNRRRRPPATARSELTNPCGDGDQAVGGTAVSA